MYPRRYATPPALAASLPVVEIMRVPVIRHLMEVIWGKCGQACGPMPWGRQRLGMQAQMRTLQGCWRLNSQFCCGATGAWR